MSIQNLTFCYQGGGKINWPEQPAPNPCNQAYETVWQRKQLNFTWIMIDKLHIWIVWNKWNEQNKLTFDAQVGGGTLNRPRQLYPTPDAKRMKPRDKKQLYFT